MTAQRILYIEGDPHVREPVRELLEDAGYVVNASSDLESAQRLLAQGAQADVVIADVALPGGDGLIARDQLRKYRPTARLILTSVTPTSYALPGVSSILSKPFSPKTLLAAIADVLEPVNSVA